MIEILVISDTHVRAAQELPKGILQAIGRAQWVVHCGDYTSAMVLEELRRLARNFVGVYGNTDPSHVRVQLPHQVTLELEGSKIAVVHPDWGGPPDVLPEELTSQFPHVDAILFGHTHEPYNQKLHDILLLNPGQGYSSFMVPASIAILTVDQGELRSEISTLD